MGLDYLDCVSLTHPQPVTDDDVARLVCAILDDDAIRFDAAQALASHGPRVSRAICELLRSNDGLVVVDLLNALHTNAVQSNPQEWDDDVIELARRHLESDDENVRAQAMMFYATVGRDRDCYAGFLCDLAAKENRRLRFLSMGALSQMYPVPASCKPKLERLLVQLAGDPDFLDTVTTRLSEIE